MSETEKMAPTASFEEVMIVRPFKVSQIYFTVNKLSV